MTYGICSLGGMNYAYNPRESKNPVIRAVGVTETLTGRVFTDFGYGASRRTVEQKFPVMDATFYTALLAKYLTGGTLPFVDDDGTASTVVFSKLDFKGRITGGDAYLDVAITLLVVS